MKAKRKAGQADSDAEPVERVQLTVEAGLYVDQFYLREPLGKADVEDGRTIEIAANVDGCVLCTVQEEKNHWRTYAISPRAFVEAVLRAEQERQTAAEDD